MIEYTVKVHADGTKHWYLNGQLHREDGPAVECANGDKHWYLNDQRHREAGPAIENADGDKCWYLNGQDLTEEEFDARMNLSRRVEELTVAEISKLLGYEVKVVR